MKPRASSSFSRTTDHARRHLAQKRPERKADRPLEAPGSTWRHALVGAGRLLRAGSLTLEMLTRARLAQRRGASAAESATLLAHACAELSAIHAFDIRLSGTIPTRPSIIVANHLSYIDPVVLAGLVPCVPIAKGEIAGWPVIGPSASALGVLFVNRDSVHSGARALRGAMRALDVGVSVLGFPEGTTTRGEPLPFRRGLFGVARLCGVPIIPVAIRYAPELCWVGDDYFFPHYVRTSQRMATVIHVEFGAPLLPVSPASVLAERARASVRRMLREPHVHRSAQPIQSAQSLHQGLRRDR